MPEWPPGNSILDHTVVLSGAEEWRGTLGSRLIWRGAGPAVRIVGGSVEFTNIRLVAEGIQSQGALGAALVEVTGSAEFTATECHFSGGPGNGVDVGGQSRARLVSCTLTSHAGSGVVARDCAEVTIEGGTITGCLVDGGLATGWSTIRAARADIRACGLRGLELTDMAELIEEDCAVSACGAEPRSVWHLGLPFGPEPYPSRLFTDAEGSAWIIAQLRNERLGSAQRHALLARARAHVEWALAGVVSEELSALLAAMEHVVARVPSEGWPPVEVELWRSYAGCCPALGLARPDFAAALVEHPGKGLPNATALGVERAESDVLWAGDANGGVWRWTNDGFTLVVSVDGSVTHVSVRPDRLLVQTAAHDVFLLDTRTGEVQKIWRQAHELSELVAITPMEHDAIIALCDKDGHPTDRCSRVMKVAVHQNVGAGRQLAICQGESIWVNETAAYAETEPGSPARIPLDGSEITPFNSREITQLLCADDPPGWRVTTTPRGVRLTQKDGSEQDFDGAPSSRCVVLLCSGRWLLTLADVVTVWDTGTGLPVAKAPFATRQAVRVGEQVVLLDAEGAMRWFSIWKPA